MKTSDQRFTSSRACLPREILFAVLVGTTLLFESCTGVDDIRIGMSETELVGLLGASDSRITDKDKMKLYATDEHCPSDVEQVWVYERRIRDDIMVGFNLERRVKCAWDATVFEIIN